MRRKHINPQTRALNCKWEESRGVEIETHDEFFKSYREGDHGISPRLKEQKRSR